MDELMVRRMIGVFSVILITVALLTAPPAAAVSVIKAEGSFERLEDEAISKRRAIDSALRKAVEDAVDTLMSAVAVDENALMLEDAVFSKVLDFILNYRILSEGWVIHHDTTPRPDPSKSLLARPASVEFYHVWVEARLDTARLKERLSEFTEAADVPTRTVTVIILNVTDYATYDSIKTTLARVGMVKTLMEASFARGRIEFSADVAGTAHTLLESLSGELGPGFALIPSGPNRLIIEAENQTTGKIR